MNESEEVINSSLSPTPSPSFIYHFATHHGHKADEADFFLIFVATIGGMIGMLTILMLYRHCLKKREFTYTRVHHGLDPEEQEFKRALESQVFLFSLQFYSIHFGVCVFFRLMKSTNSSILTMNSKIVQI